MVSKQLRIARRFSQHLATLFLGNEIQRIVSLLV